MREIRGLGKRQKSKNKGDFKTKEFYEAYINEIEKDTVYHVTKTIHTNILKEFNMEIMKLIIEKNFEYIIPFKLGNLRIKNRKVKLKLKQDGSVDCSKLPVDWIKTRELWNKDIECYNKRKLVYCTNEHSDEYKAFFYWNKKRCNFKHSYYKSFTASRTNKRWLAATIKNPDIKVKYYE